jgi:Tfp pilus assembly protein PilF
VNFTVISTGIVIVIALAIVIFVIFARKQIIDAFFPKKAASPPPALPIEQLLTRAYARRDTGDTAGARRDFEEVLRRMPNHPDAEAIRAEIAQLK